MTEEQKARIGDRVAHYLDDCDVLYVPEQMHDPDQTSQGIHDLIVQSVIDAITVIDRE